MSSTASSHNKRKRNENHIRMYSMLFKGPDKKPHFVKFVIDHIRSDFNLSEDEQDTIVDAIHALNKTHDYNPDLDDTIDILLDYDNEITDLFDTFKSVNEERRKREGIFEKSNLVKYLRGISNALQPIRKTSSRSHTMRSSMRSRQIAHKYKFKSMFDENGFTEQAKNDAINVNSRVITFTANTHNLTHTVSVCILIAPSSSGLNVYYFDQELINAVLEDRKPYRGCYVQYGSDVWLKLQEFYRSSSGHEFELNIQSMDMNKEGLIRTIIAYDVIKTIDPQDVTIDQKFQQISITQKYAAIMMGDVDIDRIINHIIQLGQYETSFEDILTIVSNKYSNEIYIYNEVPSLPSSTNIQTFISMLRSVTKSNTLKDTRTLQCSMWASIANHSHNLYTPSEIVVTNEQLDCLKQIVELFKMFQTSHDLSSFFEGLDAQLYHIDKENATIRIGRRHNYVLGSFASHLARQSASRVHSTLSRHVPNIFRFGRGGGRKTRRNKKSVKQRKYTRKNI